MVKRWMTILFLLVFSVLPAAAEVYQAADLICEALSQADDDGGIMECCTIAGGCTMQEMQEQAATECLTQCLCGLREPLLPVGLLTDAPQLPQMDDTMLSPAPLIRWAEISSTNSLLRFSPPPKNSLANFRHTCLRI